MLFNEGKFNLGLFADRQDLIWTKYDSLENGLDLIKSEREFINNFDRYIIQTLEEVYEVQLENSYEEVIKELIDIAMYLGTMYSIIRKNAIKYFNENNYHIVYGDISKLTVEENKNSFNDLVSEILFDLMSIRRYFGKRKWHKQSKELSVEEKIDTIYIMEECLRNSILKVISYTLDYVTKVNTKNPDEYIQHLILIKQDFVICLKEKNID